MPVTISGVTSDRYKEPESSREPRFHSPYAVSVPATVEIKVETTAMIAMFHAASAISASENRV